MPNKTFSINSLLQSEFKTYELSEKWLKSLGKPARNFKMIIWGQSGSGKTTFSIQLARELQQYGKVYYNSVEQGKAESLKKACVENGLHKDMNIRFGNRQSWEEMLNTIDRTYPKFVFIDSMQYVYKMNDGELIGNLGLTTKMYTELKNRYKKRDLAFIFVSHQEGKDPKGKYAKAIRYDVDIKCHVENGVAKADSRFGITEPYYIFGKNNTAVQTSMF